MIIADTSVWIEFLKGSENIKDHFSSHLKNRRIIAISPVFGELLQGARNRRERDVISGFWYNLPRIDERDLFIEAGMLSNREKFFSKGVGLIDCFILAAGIQNDYSIWTLDKNLLKAIERLAG